MPRFSKKNKPTPSYLFLQDILSIHEGIMLLTGFEPQPLRLGGENTLGSALARPQHAAYYEAASVIRQAALLCIGISQAQAFLDGNKRTAVAATEIFLKSTGLKLKPHSISLAQKLEEIAEGLAKDFSPENRENLENSFEEWFGNIVIPI